MAKKRPTKVAIKKKAAKKKTANKKTAKTSTARTKATSTKSSTSKKSATKKSATKKSATKKPQAAFPRKLFPGRTFALAGRFGYRPDKDQLREFIRSSGGKVAAKIDAKLDYLLVGEGGTSAAQKQVEKLNQAGKASIQIVDNIDELTAIDADLTRRILVDPSSLKNLIEVRNNFSWLDVGCDLSGSDFSGKSIGVKGTTLYLGIYDLDGCVFNRAKLTDIMFDADFDLSTCSFERAQMHHVWFLGTESLHLNSVKASDLSFGETTGCVMESCTIDKISPRRLHRCKIIDSKISSMNTAKVDRGEFNQTEFQGCRLTDPSLNNVTLTKCSIKNTVLDGGRLNQVRFEKCKLSNVIFRNIEIDAVEFVDCELSEVQFVRARIAGLGLTSSKLSKLQLTKCQQSGIRLGEKQLSQVKGIDAAKLVQPISSPAAKKIADAILRSDEFASTIKGKLDGKSIAISISKSWYSQKYEWKIQGRKASESGEDSLQQGNWTRKLNRGDVLRALDWLALKARGGKLTLKSLTVKTAKCPLNPKETKRLLAEVWSEIFEIQAPTEAEQVETQRSKSADKRANKALVLDALANSKPNSVNKVGLENIREIKDLKKLNLPGKKLARVKLCHTQLHDSDFSGSDLTSADFSHTNCRGANFSKCVLEKAKFVESNVNNVDFRDANLRGADFSHARFSGVNLKRTDLSGANLTNAWLTGVDLSQAKLAKAKLKDAVYDRKTNLPPSIPIESLRQMCWNDSGIPPHEQKRNLKLSGAIDFETFLARLTEITDPSRLKKAVAMLKKDAFQLFAEISDAEVVGVIKSQTDAKLLYSARLSAGGWFSCCTQNLNPCGGLRGAVCKHILVLVIGLARSGELDAAEVDEWINESKLRRPDVDKDRMSEILLKYKGVEAGEVDWRPTETVPEDYYVL